MSDDDRACSLSPRDASPPPGSTKRTRSPSPIKVEDEPSAPEAAAPEEQQQHEAKRARPATREGDRKRGQRLFGVLVGTLNKFKDESAQKAKSEAAQRREKLEARLQTKLRAESNRYSDARERALHTKRDQAVAARKEEEVGVGEAMHKARITALLSSSHFFISSPSPSLPPTALAPHQTLVKPALPSVYYLPAVLTPAQEDALAMQRRAVEEAADAERQRWAAQRKALLEEVVELRRKVAEEALREGREEKERERLREEAKKLDEEWDRQRRKERGEFTPVNGSPKKERDESEVKMEEDTAPEWDESQEAAAAAGEDVVVF